MRVCVEFVCFGLPTMDMVAVTAKQFGNGCGRGYESYGACNGGRCWVCDSCCCFVFWSLPVVAMDWLVGRFVCARVCVGLLVSLVVCCLVGGWVAWLVVVVCFGQ